MKPIRTKKRTFPHTKFPRHVLDAAIQVLEKYASCSTIQYRGKSYSVTVRSEQESGLSEAEFFGRYNGGVEYAYVYIYFEVDGYDNMMFIRMSYSNHRTEIEVGLSAEAEVDEVLEVFERARENAYDGPPRQVFIGHGKGYAWKELCDHLRDMHGVKPLYFEDGVNATEYNMVAVRGRVDDAACAIIVHTADDEVGDCWQARQNVVHETGFCQGRLGIEKTLILREGTCAPFSNLAGMQELRFPSNHVSIQFGNIVSWLRKWKIIA